ncbi:uroporphyrinogen decarboxylase [Microbacterium sp. MEC084]|uniref:uroporphyrinogen decarboxylase n=1 Tax=Microbacterium sp. MEC084 TaxID=1963027 RepID=UPI00106F96E5|nr:uroporphyrinogen decarboxylase [Microbacterium sp. MEC084]MCD1269353.1 uroporphyrinogen decarboxylase [Microbacterium sp. MEC084]
MSHADAPEPRAPLSSSALLRALAGDRPETAPVWFMRQAGRSLPEYRELRVGTRMLDACLTPDLAAEITLQPVRRHGVDAAVFFSDIVVPLRLAGVEVEIEPGRGPVFASPVRTAVDVARITAIAPADVAAAAEPVREAVRLTVAELDRTGTPLIGFAGAPFTLAAYLVEGGPSKEHLRARAMMQSDPGSWNRLAGWLSEVSRAFLQAQIEAGAAAVQLFDSWAGSLAPAVYRSLVAPQSRAAVTDLPVPVIHFGVGTGPFLADMRLDGAAAAVGVDWRQPLDEAAALVGPDTTLQGNIDPALLGAPWEVLEAHVRDVVERGRAARAHIVNLGHGVPPEADPAVLTRVVELVHSIRS